MALVGVVTAAAGHPSAQDAPTTEKPWAPMATGQRLRNLAVFLGQPANVRFFPQLAKKRVKNHLCYFLNLSVPSQIPGDFPTP